MNVLIQAEKRSAKNVSAGSDFNPLKGCLPVKVECNVMERILSERFSPDQTLAAVLTFHIVYTCL